PSLLNLDEKGTKSMLRPPMPSPARRIAYLAVAVLAGIAWLQVGAQTAAVQRGPDTSSSTGTVVVTGRILAAGSNRPLRRARVVLSGSALTASLVTSSDEEGKFEFVEVPPGRYQLAATKTGYLQAQFGQQRPNGPGRVLEVQAGRPVAANLA